MSVCVCVLLRSCVRVYELVYVRVCMYLCVCVHTHAYSDILLYILRSIIIYSPGCYLCPLRSIFLYLHNSNVEYMGGDVLFKVCTHERQSA